ncbi:Crp/Fnr family transcriptional regulator [Neolewinella persica]|uniref:Crp/Fnr family transcriptional regulator n=1 Tax=Neolewinella persica TaxID=70998 RepID=UPI001FDEA5E7|nr:Crp/Fnr family transcriptional regulator [Neolewinella persica]
MKRTALGTLTKYWFLEGFNLFSKLGMNAMMELCEELVMHRYSKGARINLDSGDEQSVYFLKKGSVKIVSSDTEVAKFIAHPGNIFGELGLYQLPGEGEETAYALEESVVCTFSANQMNELMAKHPSLKNGVLKIYGFRIKRLERRLQDLLHKDSGTRIEEFIRYYVTAFGVPVNGRQEARKLLSHKDIAHLTNTSRQTVNNVLTGLRREGTIDYNAKVISILSPEEKINRHE